MTGSVKEGRHDLRTYPRRRPKPRIGLVAGGLGAYWTQFPDFLAQLERSAARVTEWMREFDAEVIDVGFICDAQEGAAAAENLRGADCDLIVGSLTTYMTATMLVPITQRSGAPVLLINLQPTESMDHASFDTGAWLAYCGAWQRIGRWIRSSGVRSVLRNGRHGLMGHLYPGMYDVSTDLTIVPGNLGGHVEVLEFDDLRVRVERVDEGTDEEVAGKLAETREVFEIDGSVVEDDLLVGLGQSRDGRYKLVASEGKVVGGPLLKIGNTTSRVDFGCDPGEWTDAWSASGVAHHWALATGSILPDLRALAGLTGLELVEVSA